MLRDEGASTPPEETRQLPGRARLAPHAAKLRIFALEAERRPHAAGERPGKRAHAGRDTVRRMTHALLLALAAAVAPGQKAPAFSLETTSGKKSLDDYKGQTLVLAFFPKAFTGG